MAKLPRLNSTYAIIDTETGKALKYFTRLWDEFASRIEASLTALSTGFVVFNGGGAISRTLTAGTGLHITDGDGIAGNPTYSLANTAVAPGPYGDATHSVTLTVDAQGRLTAIVSVAIAAVAVTSIFGRVGAVVAAANDYTFAQIGTKPTTIAGYGITDAVSNALVSTKIYVGIAGGVAAAVNVSGDAALSNAGALTVTKTNGVAFAAVATSGAKADVGLANVSNKQQMPLDGTDAMTAPLSLKSYTVAGLPAVGTAQIAYASNGRKNGEGAGAGTGVMVFSDGTNWRACDTGATVAA